MSNIYRIYLIALFLIGLLIPSSEISPVWGVVQPTFVSKFGYPSCNKDGELNFPSGIAVDNDGNVYVCEEMNNRISKFDSEGNFLTKWSSLGCLGVATDNNNNVYVVRQTLHKISKYDSNGTLIREWGSFGTGNGQFNTPRDTAVNKNLGLVYVMDSSNYRVQVFDTEGNFKFKWGSYGSGDSQFGGSLGPFGIAVDQNSNAVYVADTGRTIIKKFDSNGNFLLKWGEPGKNPGQIRWPRGIDVNNSGYVYVAETDNERIEKFDPNGNFVMGFQGLHDPTNGPFHPRAVATDPRNGNIFAAASYAHRIDKFDPSGNRILTFGRCEKVGGAFNNPQGMAIDNLNGYLYVADTYNFQIQKFATNGNFILSWGYSSRVSSIYDGGDGSFDFPSTLTIDNGGNIYDLRTDTYYPGDPELRRIQKFDPNGNFLSSWNHPDFKESMLGILYNPYSHYLYIANTPNNKIQFFTTDGQYISEFGGAGNTDGKFNSPARLAVDQNNGNIYVVDAGNNRIQKFSSAGTFLTKWGQYGTDDGQFKLSTYSGIYADKNGYVYVADTGNTRIQVFDSNGNFILKWGQWGGLDGGFIYPRGVVVNNEGFIYVLDAGKNNVQKFTSIYPDVDGDGYTSYLDCNDNDPTVNPGATEVCDGKDNDCNSLTIDGSGESWYGNPTTCGVGACSSTGQLTCSGGAQVDTCTPGTPQSEEVCDGADNNCNGQVDEGLSDLYISSASAPVSATPGQTISISDTTNKSGCAIGATTTKIYLSTINTYWSGATYLGSRAMPAFGIGAQSSSGSTNVTIPASTPAGSYYIVVRADGGGAIAEWTEGNNIRAISILITANVDFYVSSVTAPGSAVANTTISVSDTTNKSGSGVAGTSTTKIYLSTNNSYSANDIYLGSRAVPAFGTGNGSSSGSTSVTIPPKSVCDRTYYLIARADADNVISEWSEGNNIRAISIAITGGQVDLFVSSMSAPGTATAGSTISVSDTTNKIGCNATVASTTKIYLSTINTYWAGATYLGSRAVPAFGTGNGSSSGSTSVTIPSGTPAGSYYIVVKADGGGAITESAEGNNFRTSAITIP